MNIKKIIVRISFIFLALIAFTACTESSIDEEVSKLEEIELYASDKGGAGSIGQSSGDDSDDDYN